MTETFYDPEAYARICAAWEFRALEPHIRKAVQENRTVFAAWVKGGQAWIDMREAVEIMLVCNPRIPREDAGCREFRLAGLSAALPAHRL